MQDEIGRLREVLQAHVALMERFREHGAPTTTTQTTNINAGGVGLLIALLLCAFLAGLNLTQSARNASLAVDMARMQNDINEVRRRNDLANDKLSVVLQWAPDLAKKVDASTNPKKGENAP